MSTNACLVSSIESEISIVKENLKGVDESLKRLTGRDFGEHRNDRRIRNINRDMHITKRDEEPAIKKKGPMGIFARLGAPILDGNKDYRENRHRPIEFSRDNEDKPRKRPSLSSSVGRPVNDGKSRSDAAAELTKDRASRDRNKRMFGALLGTLQRFQTDEAKQKDKEEQRAAIEKKLEDKGKAEKEELRKERVDLFNQRLEQQAKIKFLQYKMNRVREHESWENHQKKLRKFIRTVSKPNLFWLPKLSTDKSNHLIKKTKVTIDKELEETRQQLKRELEDASSRKGIVRKEESEEESEELHNVKRKHAEDNLEDTLEDLEDNCDDILDFEVEEPRQVEEVIPSGKGSNPERVVVQVGSGVNGLGNLPQRRVELVPASHNGMKERSVVETQSKSDAREIKVVVKRERSNERESMKKCRIDDGSNVIMSEHKSGKSVQEVIESRGDSDVTSETEHIRIIKEKSPKKELIKSSQEDNIQSVVSVPEQPVEVSKARSKSPVEMETANSPKNDTGNATGEPNVVTVTPEKEISQSIPSKLKGESDGSSSSEYSDDYDDSSSTSESESSETDSSDTTSSSSTDSEIEKKREMRKKSIMAVRKREEERRKKRTGSSSDSDDEKHGSKRKRDASQNERSTGDKTHQDKRVKRSDEQSTKDNRKRSRSRDRHRRRSAERKARK